MYAKKKKERKKERKKKELENLLTPYIGIKAKSIKNLNVKTWNHKYPRRKISDIAHSNIFFWYITRGKGNKRKSKQMGLDQAKKFLQGKGNLQQNKKTTH